MNLLNTMKTLLIFLITFVSLFAQIESKRPEKKTELIDPLIHDIQIISAQTWDNRVSKHRENHVFLIFFYEPDEDAKIHIKETINDLATQLKDKIVVGSVDCSKHGNVCARQGAKNLPALFVYPTFPFPQYEYTEKPYNVQKILNTVLRLVPGKNVNMLNTEGHEKFITSSITVPKVLLFSEKTSAPTIFKLLSNHFINKLQFAFINVTENPQLLEKYKSKNYPAIRIVRHGKPDESFDGEIEYHRLKTWMNVFAETFVMGGGYAADSEAADAKPWKHQSIPQLTSASQQDICLKSKGLCVIYVKNGPVLSFEEQKLLENLKQVAASRLGGRGIEYKWMWLNLQPEKNWQEELLLKDNDIPTCVIFNPHKRIRYMKLDNNVSASKDTVLNLIEKISGGGAKFTPCSGNKFPSLSLQDTPDAKRTEL